MNAIRFLLLDDSKLTDNDTKFVKRYLRRQKRLNSALYLFLILILGATSFLWLFGYGYTGTEMLVSKLDLNITLKTKKILQIILHWTVPIPWLIIGSIFQRRLENRKQNLIELSKTLNKKFKCSF